MQHSLLKLIPEFKYFSNLKTNLKYKIMSTKSDIKKKHELDTQNPNHELAHMLLGMT